MLFAGPPNLVESVIPQLGHGSSIIGSIVSADELGGPGHVAVVDEFGQELSLTDGGWDHFTRGSTE